MAQLYSVVPMVAAQSSVWFPLPLKAKLGQRVFSGHLSVGNVPGVPVKFSAWPDKMDLRTARLGEDNERVLKDLLNLPDDQIKKLYAEGILVRDKTLETQPSKG